MDKVVELAHHLWIAIAKYLLENSTISGREDEVAYVDLPNKSFLTHLKTS